MRVVITGGTGFLGHNGVRGSVISENELPDGVPTTTPAKRFALGEQQLGVVVTSP